MNTHVEKLDLTHWTTELQNVSVPAQINENTVVSTSETLSIEKGLADFQQDKVRSHLQVRKRYEKWL
jgi:hypothetical protein